MNKKSMALFISILFLAVGCSNSKITNTPVPTTLAPTVQASTAVPATPTTVPVITPDSTPTVTPTVRTTKKTATPTATPKKTSTPKRTTTKKPTATPVRTKTPTPIFDEDTAVKINVVGDIMCHDNLITASKVSGGYNFKPWFEDIKDTLSDGDLVIANLETTLNGRSSTKFVGYPNFNTPTQILEGLKYAGVNMVLTANNHSFDTKYSGLKNTIAELKAAGLDYTGTYTNRTDYNKPFIKEINGIKIGILNYTYATNGMASTIPSDVRPYAIRYLDYNNPKKIYKDIENIKAKGAELVIVAPHWGVEYQSTPNASQRNLAQNLMEHGADLIIGGHPHCVQRTSKRTVVTVDGETKDCIVTYSMGNFLADQRRIEKKITETGYMLSVSAVRDTTGKVHLRDASITPTWIYRYTKNSKYAYKILPLGKYATQAKPSWMDSASYTELKKEWKRVNNLLGSEGIPINKE